jgi:hypothetical protein
MNYFNHTKKQNNDVRKSSIAPLEQYFMTRDEYNQLCEKTKVYTEDVVLEQKACLCSSECDCFLKYINYEN